MKKAKIFLSIICIITGVATSFAFKANNLSTHFVYTGTLNSGICTTVRNATAIICSTGFTPNVAASTVLLTTGCPNANTIALESDN